MKLNEHSALLTPKILLVPYSPHHVPTYHEWMQDEALRIATASEPLTLEEEHSMQQSWRKDADKLTFICCTPPSLAVPNPSADQSPSGGQEAGLINNEAVSVIRGGKHDAPAHMIGDVNLFLYLSDAGEEEINQQSTSRNVQILIGEIEIMIAVTSYQNRGLGSEILLTFMWYIVTYLEQIREEYHTSHTNGKDGCLLEYLRVKISAENTRSIKLFEKVGFTKVTEEPNYFGELELRWPISAASLKEIEARMDTTPQLAQYS